MHLDAFCIENAPTVSVATVTLLVAIGLCPVATGAVQVTTGSRPVATGSV
jgi:hypothetical protein